MGRKRYGGERHNYILINPLLTMGKRLTDNLSSLYIGAANSLKPKKARRKIVAYVESYDDVSFWRSILSEYEDNSRFFEIMLPSKDTLTKGKKAALMNRLGKQLGENMIACVDSDYDYLMQGRTQTSQYMINSPYVMQTYAYAIENYHCYAEGLHDVCVMATLNDHSLIDFTEFMRQYSVIVYPLFAWSIWFYRHNKLSEFSLTDFCSYIRIEKFNLQHPEDCLRTMTNRVKRKVNDLKRKHPEALNEIEKLKTNELPHLGVNPDNTYMFVQGHHILDNVVKKLLQPVCAALRKEMEDQIRSLALHKVQMQNELAAYERSQMTVDRVLQKSTTYKSSPLYRKIKNDIDRFLKKLE